MRKIKTTVVYNVPNDNSCNSENTCRFCISLGKNGYKCALYDIPLLVEGGKKIFKADACRHENIFKRKVVIEETVTPPVDPKIFQDWILERLTLYYNASIKEGYPSDLSFKIAKSQLIKESERGCRID